MVAIVGASGSGKSTLMKFSAVWIRPPAAPIASPVRMCHAGRRCAGATAPRAFRLYFQRYHLLSHLTAEQNVEVPAVMPVLSGNSGCFAPRSYCNDWAGRPYRVLPGTAFGWPATAVSIARALMNGGQVILADEPTAHWTAILAKR